MHEATKGGPLVKAHWTTIGYAMRRAALILGFLVPLGVGTWLMKTAFLGELPHGRGLDLAPGGESRAIAGYVLCVVAGLHLIVTSASRNHRKMVALSAATSTLIAVAAAGFILLRG